MADSQEMLDFFDNLDKLAGQISGEPLPPAKYEFSIDNIKDIKRGDKCWTGNVEFTVINDDDGNDGRKVFETMPLDGYYIKNGKPMHKAFRWFSLVSCVVAKAVFEGADALFINGLKDIPYFNQDPEQMIAQDGAEQEFRNYSNRLVGLSVYGETINKPNQKQSGVKWVDRVKNDPEYREFAAIKKFLKPNEVR